MGLVPDTKQGKTNFFRSKIAPWTSSAVAIGTSVPAVTALDVLVTAAEDKLAAQAAAEGAFRAAVEQADQAVEAMAVAGANIISAIRTKGRTDSAVWALAQIPAPATPSPMPPPGTPSNLKVELDGNGALILTWKCANPAGTSGTLYQLYRAVGASNEFEYLGGAGEKKFVDGTVPAGATRLTYRIQAVRSTAVGMWAEFVVNFGTNAGGGMTAMVTDGSPAPKIAA